MKTYLFKVKTSPLYLILGFIGIACVVYVLFYINSSNSIGWIALFGALLVYMSIKKIINLASTSLKKLIITESKIEFIFANLKSPSMPLEENEVLIEISTDKIVFINNISNALIAEAFKSNISKPNQWEDLVYEVSNFRHK